MNWNPIQLPNSAMAARLARTSADERRIPSRTSGVGVRCSRITKAVRKAAGAHERRDRARRSPAGVGRVDQRVDEQQHGGGDRDCAGGVEPAPDARGPLAGRHQLDPGHQRDQRDGRRQEEDQVLPVAETPVRAEVDIALDVQRDLAAEVTLDLETVDDSAELHEIVFAEHVGLDVQVDARFLEHLTRGAAPDAVDVGERDFHALRLREIDACDTCHDGLPLTLPLLVARIAAEDPHDALTPDHLALLADLFDRCADFHLPAPFTWSGW